MKKWFIPLLALGVLAPVAWYFTERKHVDLDPLKQDTIIVGTNAEYPPFSFIQNGKLIGFDIDVAREVVHRLDKKIEFKDMAFTTLIPELQRGRVHLIAAGMTPTPERAKRIAFTEPHLTGDILVIVARSSHGEMSLENLRGKEVVVNEGYAADGFMTEWGGALLTRLNTPADAFLALKSGRAIAYVDARDAVLPFFKQYGYEQFSMSPIPGSEQVTATSLGISTNYPVFQQEVQRILTQMHDDGTLEQLKKKWGI